MALVSGDVPKYHQVKKKIKRETKHPTSTSLPSLPLSALFLRSRFRGFPASQEFAVIHIFFPFFSLFSRFCFYFCCFLDSRMPLLTSTQTTHDHVISSCSLHPFRRRPASFLSLSPPHSIRKCHAIRLVPLCTFYQSSLLLLDAIYPSLIITIDVSYSTCEPIAV